MSERTSPVPPFPWLWLVPSLLWLGVFATWGVLIYPELPDRVPSHMGFGGIDAWADKSVVTVFLVPFVHAGMTALVAGCAVGLLRATPEDEMVREGPWAAAEAAMRNRPASVASAVRTAKSLLAMNAILGLVFAECLRNMWRTSTSSEVAVWSLPLVIGLIALSVLPVLVAGWRDRAELRARAAGRSAEAGTAGASGDDEASGEPAGPGEAASPAPSTAAPPAPSASADPPPRES